jgi:hypothetical protein
MSFLDILCEFLAFLVFDTPVGRIPVIGDLLNDLGARLCDN